MPLAAGSRLGPYEILAPLGAGGMGEVYRARDARLGRDVAVKVLPTAVASDPDRRARFEREGRAVAALSHPNILAIFDVGVAGGTAYAVTELLEGATLRDHLDGPLPIRRAVDIAAHIARGLAAAHDKGIVHRDLKPENVFVLGDGQVKILDFGVAKAVGDARGQAETDVGTDPGTALGTVGYMAPEQIRGQAVDGRADLFALGAVLYEMLAGRRAFQRETGAETMAAILKEDPTDLSVCRGDVPLALDAIVRHCLERNPAERFQSARDLVFNLQAASVASGSAPVSTAGGSLPQALGLARREAIAWALVAALALALGAEVVSGRLPPSGSAPSAARFQVLPPEKTSWGAPVGAAEGSNSGTISPDGTMLAFVASDAGGTAMLWVRPLDSLTARVLPGTEGAAFPFWRPDSRYLGFFTRTELKTISPDGGPVQTIAELASTPRGGTWSAAGVILLATAGSPIMRTSAAGGPLTPVTKPDADNPGTEWPSFLPDGQRFLYYGAGTGGVYLGSLDSGAIRRLGPSDTNGIFAPPDRILFMRQGSLFAQRFDLTRGELTGEPTPLAERVSWNPRPWNLGAFSVSANGRLTSRLRGGGVTQFAWFDRSGRRIASVGPPGEYLYPALSADGKTIAFTRRDEQSAGDIWTMDLERQTQSRVTVGGAGDTYPVWAPDGSMIIYASAQDGLLAMGVPTPRPPRTLFAGPANGLTIPSQVSADGTRLLFFGDLGRPSGFDIFVLPLTAAAKPMAVIQSDFADVEPQWSPDGRWLAYASSRSGDYQVLVQPFPTTGGGLWQISTGGGRQPSWRGDGGELFYVTNDRKLYAVDVRAGATFDFGTPHFLFVLPANTIAVRNSYVPSRDGKRFLVNMLVDTTMPPINVDLDWRSSAAK